MLYLIAHKVRGEPAFDVAEQMQVGDETWWIVPTSGHRAYPYKWSPIPDYETLEGMPDDLPDHYPAPKRASVKAAMDAFDDILKDLEI